MLRSIRLSRGLTQRDLAKASGITQPRIAQVEKGVKPLMQPPTVDSIAAALSLDRSVLVAPTEVLTSAA